MTGLTPAAISFGRHYARWAIALADGSTVHLCQDFSAFHFVVHADAARLQAALRAQAGHPLDRHPWPRLRDLPDDYKFADAERPMRRSVDWPVPLPDLSLYDDCILFTNGVTRTRWLISNGATSFPVAADEGSAAAMQALIGLPDQAPIRAASLAPLASPAGPPAGL